MDKGCIVERGDHSTLIALDGVYKKLVLRQLTSSNDGEGTGTEDAGDED